MRALITILITLLLSFCSRLNGSTVEVRNCNLFSNSSGSENVNYTISENNYKNLSAFDLQRCEEPDINFSTPEDNFALAVNTFNSAKSPAAYLNNATIVLTILETNVTCFGNSNGAIDLTVTGGIPNYTYEWTPGAGGVIPSGQANNQNLSGLTAGTYNVIVTDSNGDKAPLTSITITQPSALSPGTTSTNSPVCQGSTLNLNISPTGGTLPYTYAWTGPNSFTSTISNPNVLNALPAASGTYLVTIMDANNCTTSSSIDVTVNPSPSVNNPTDQTVCNGTSTSGITYTGTGTSYTWVNNNAAIGLAVSGTGDIASFTATNSGIATVMATIIVTPHFSNGGITCDGLAKTFTITVKPSPEVTATPASQSFCSGGTSSVVLTSNVTGTSFTWTTAIAPAGSISGATDGTGNSIAQTLTNSTQLQATITYTVIPSVNGCPGSSANIPAIVYPIPQLSSPVSENVCSSSLFSYTPASDVSGTTFNWTRAAVLGIQNVAASGTGAVNETLINNTGSAKTVAYVYTLTANGCTHVQNVAVTVLPLPLLLSSVTPPAVCSNTSFNYVAVSSISGTTMTWVRGIKAGISNPPGSGPGNITETLINTTASDVVVPYVYTLLLAGCSNTFTVNATIKPTPVLSSTLSPVAICSNSVFSYNPESLTTGTTFNWSRNPVAGISNSPASGTGNPNETLINTTPNPLIVTYVYILRANGCPQTQNVLVTVNPVPEVDHLINEEFCNGETTSLLSLKGSVAGSTFTWSNNNTAIGLASNGSGDIPSFIATNSTSAPINAAITVTPSANGCAGTSLTFLITVNPPPAADVPANQAICNGAPSNAIVFTGTFATISWTNDHPEIGLAASGTGDISLFTATNPGTDPIVAIITVTPHFSQSGSGCDGIPVNFTITVNPTPRVNAIVNETLCPSASHAGYNFSTTATGGSATFSWTSSNNVGFGISGSGMIPSFTVAGNGSSPLNTNVNVTATINGCTGGATTFAITINPVPAVDQPADEVVCNNGLTNAIHFTGTATSFAWTNSNSTIGLAGSGTGDIGVFTAINSGSTPVIAVITVTPIFTASGITCQGASKSFNVTVNPYPTATITGTTSVCQYAPDPVITFTGNQGTAPYTFTYNINGGVNRVITTTSGNSVTINAPSSATGTFVYSLVNVTSSMGCTQAQSGTATIIVVAMPTAWVSGTTTVCQNTAAPTITFTGTGGSPIYIFTYTINGGANQTVSTITGFSAMVSVPTTSMGTYVYTLVNVASSAGCGQNQTSTATITVAPAPNGVISGTTSVCQNTAAPLITFTGSNTTAPYTFNYNINGGTNQTVTTTSGNSITISAPTGTAGTFNYNLVSVSGNGGCSQALSASATVTVNPVPALTSSLTPPGICTNTAFNYTHTSSISGTSFSWIRAVVTGISNSAGSGSVYPNETLINTTLNPVSVTYAYTLTKNGCTNMQDVVVMVTPIPTLNSSQTPPGVCSGSVFSYTPTSPTSGTIFSWNRPAVAGISNPTASGTGNPNEALINSTLNPLTVTYNYTLSSNNCANPTIYPVTVSVTTSAIVTASATPTIICPGGTVNLSSSSNISPLPTTLLSENFNATPTGWTTTNTSSGGTTANAAWTLRASSYVYSSTTFRSNDNTQFYISNSQAQGSGGTTNTTLVSPSINTVGYSNLQLDFWHYYNDNSNNDDIAYVEVSTNGSAWTTVQTFNSDLGNSNPFDQHSTIDLSAYINKPVLYIRFRYYATNDYYWALDNVTVSGTIVPTILWTSNTSGWTSSIANPVGVAPATTTIYTATYTNPTTQCSGSKTATVTVRAAPTPTITADYCIIRPIVRLTTGAYSSYLWNTGATTQVLDVDIAGKYTVTVTDANGCQGTTSIQVADELVVNGDFSAGNTGFTTGYGYVADISGNSELGPEGLYGVGPNGQNYHSNFWGYDHTTKNGTQNYMIVNGWGSSLVVWEEANVPVTPNTDYYFAAWAMSLNNIAICAKLRFEVNGVQVGSTANLVAGVNSNANPWRTQDRFYGMWNSGSATTASIRIINLEPNLNGNDFGLDDISFGTLASIPFTVTASNNSPICSRSTLQLNSATSGGKPTIVYTWTGPNGFLSHDANPVIANVSPSAGGVYTLSVTDAYNCPPEVSTTTVTLNPTPEIPNQSALICSGSTFTATPANGVPDANTFIPTGTTFSWPAPTVYPLGSVTGSSAQSSQTVISQTLTNTTGATATVTYIVTPVFGGCTGNTFNVVVTVNAVATVNAGSAQQICAGNTVQLNGSVGGSATSGTWSGGTGTFTPNSSTLNAVYRPGAADIAAGNVTLSLMTNDPDGAGPCPAVSSTVIFTINALPVVTSTHVNVDCHGSSAGSIDLSVSGGAPGYTYTWTAGNGGVVPLAQINSQDLTGLVAGTYTVTVSDTKSCGANLSIIITEPAVLEAHESHPAVPCAGGASSVTITATGGTPPYSGTGTFSQLEGTVVYTVTGAGGCSATVSVTVTADPNSAPVITTCPVTRDFNGCSPAVISGPLFSNIDANSSYAEFSDANNQGVASDNCAITAVTYKDVAVYTCPISVTRTWKLFDASGLNSTCQQNIHVSDIDAPTWTTALGSLGRTVECSNAAGLVSAMALFPVASDNCDADVSNIVKTTGLFIPSAGCNQRGSYTNTWTVTDECGNISAVYNQLITITDNTAPTWITAAGSLDRTMECSNSAALAAAQALKPTASDNCDLNVTNVVKAAGAFVPGSCGNQGTYTNTWTVTDDCGNISSTFTQVITTTDTTSPVWMTAPTVLNETVGCSNTGALATAQAMYPIALDNCDADVSNIIKSAGSFVPSLGCIQEGTYTNTWTVTDDCGNPSPVFTQVITIENNIAPIIYCPSSNAFSCESPLDPTVTGMAVASSDCDPNPVLTWSDITISGSCAGNYQIIRTWKATDACGNLSTCQQTIFVQDVTSPVISCAVSGNQSVDYNSPTGYDQTNNSWDASATDNCGNVILTASLTGATISGPFTSLNGVSFNEGSTTVTWTANDGCDNIVSCQFTVTVRPRLIVTCLPDINHNEDTDACSATFNPGLPTIVSGVEPITFSWVMTGVTTGSGTGSIGLYTFNPGITTIAWTITNISGTVFCTQIITVVDNIKPTFALPAAFSACVEILNSAIYNSATQDINPNRPDYYVFVSGNNALDLNVLSFNDNCPLSCAVEIRWKIDMNDGSQIPALPVQYQTGQPSTFGSDIQFLGDGINFTSVVHTITYWIVDCVGNVSDPQTQTITIKPRPNITLIN